MNYNVPLSYNAYYNGWLLSGSSNGVSIHHPSGDPKKISTYTQSLQSASWNSSGGGTHWRVYWSSTVNGHGVSEGGSSGSPIFTSSGLIVGQLTGGSSTCTSPYSSDLYGKMSFNWQTNGSTPAKQLKPWLDPNGTNIFYLNGNLENGTFQPNVFDCKRFQRAMSRRIYRIYEEHHSKIVGYPK